MPELLSAGVDTAWVRRYDGPAHLGSSATRVAVDGQGNVAVTGVSAGADSTPDWVTIKYSSAGDSLWADRRSFTGNGKPLGLGVDTAGNVYVTGYQNTQAVTIKYSSTGQLLWESRLASESYAKDLGLDAAGNVFICGSALSSSHDFLTVKYRSDGDTAWTRFCDWAGFDDYALATARSQADGIATTGYGATSTTHIDCVTVARDSTGNQLWATSYDGPNHGVDVACALAIDDRGSVITTGYGDNGYGTTTDYLTIKYDSSGETLWTRKYDGPGHAEDEASAVTVDGDGNVYVTGFSTGDTTVYDYATVKYTSSGEQAWAARYDGPGHLLDEAKAIAVMPSGEALVTGYAYGGSSRRNDCTTVMYDSCGQQMWQDAYNSGGSDAGGAIALGPEGSFYVAGSAGGKLLVIKYVPDGGVGEGSRVPVARLTSLVAEPSVFSSVTALHLSVKRPAAAQVVIYDAEGRCVRKPLNGDRFIGTASVTWDGCDERGVRLSPGVYIVVLKAGEQSAKVKVVMSE